MADGLHKYVVIIVLDRYIYLSNWTEINQTNSAIINSKPNQQTNWI